MATVAEGRHHRREIGSWKVIGIRMAGRLAEFLPVHRRLLKAEIAARLGIEASGLSSSRSSMVDSTLWQGSEQ